MKLPSKTWAREVHRLLRRGARNAVSTERCPISIAVRKRGLRPQQLVLQNISLTTCGLVDEGEPGEL